jgi:hypothetical protein
VAAVEQLLLSLGDFFDECADFFLVELEWAFPRRYPEDGSNVNLEFL